MTTVAEFLEGVGRVVVAKGSPQVCRTVAAELRGKGSNRLSISVGTVPDGLSPKKAWVFFHVDGERAELAASDARYLYSFARWLIEVKGDEKITRWSRPRLRSPAFLWQRPVYDLYFAQSARSIRNLDREDYVREMARSGFTHLEVNSLAFPEAAEEGVEGEVYPRFYTYLPALDQFVTSKLNRGIYPASYLKANLRRLTENAAFAKKYGLVPTLTCFEPRSVPEKLLEKYPELRGCRVDHPFRSFKPRFNLAVGHPMVKDHYRELIGNLMKKVPDLGCLSVWTNDSGAGFEYTRTLYVGANGSAYLVREWSDEDIFARAAAGNAVGFLRLLKESAAKVNPDFRVVTRLEPFGPERDYVLDGLGDGLDIEVPTMLSTGWDCPYKHPEYKDSRLGPFTIYNHEFSPEERRPIAKLAKKDCRTHVMLAHGPVNNFEPLLGIPSPWLVHEKLAAMRAVKVNYLSHLGGIAPPASVKWQPNHEVYRRFLFDPAEDVETALHSIARSYVGPDAEALVSVWRQTEKAIRRFMPNPLYFLWGVWYRLLIRPLVPNIEAIPVADRAYYERHLLSTHHNPNRVDLSRDVLFDLVSVEEAAVAVQRIEERALPALDKARALLAKLGEHEVFTDLRDRLDALRCFMVTRAHVAAWIANVRGYMETEDPERHAAQRKALSRMVRAEIANTKELLALLTRSDTELMSISSGEETTFIYDERFAGYLEQKIELMKKYGGRKPHIDFDLKWRVANAPRA
jgi:hypothetical protein